MSLSIGEVVASSGVSHDTLRFYEREGMIPPPDRTLAGHRRYPTSVLLQLSVIGDLRRAGFGLASIRNVLSAKSPGSSPAQRVAAARLRLDDLDAELDARQAAITRARELIQDWRAEIEQGGPYDDKPREAELAERR